MEFVSRLRNLVALAYFVPPERVRPLVPAQYELERFGDQAQQAMVATLSFSHDPCRPASLRFPSLRFQQVTFRVFVRRAGSRGVYFVRTYLSSWQAGALLALSQAAARGRFQSRFQGGEIFLRAQSGGRLCEIAGRRSPERRLHFPGLGGRAEAVAAVTHVLRGFVRSRAGFHLEVRVEHPLMDPDDLTLDHIQLDEWKARGVLTAEEMRAPAAAFFQPHIVFRFQAPRLA